MRAALFCLLVWLVGMGLYAQQRTESVVYLKNGSILRGELVQPENLGKISIRIMGNNLFVFDMSEVEMITTEPVSKSGFAPAKGYVSVTEGGALVSTGAESAGLMLHTVHGYAFNPYLQVGAGVGLNVYFDLPPNYYYYYYNRSTKLIPLFANVSGDLLPAKRVSPYYYGRVGYGIDVTNRENYVSSHGGLMFGGGVGMKVKGKNQIGWVMGVGYQLQQYYTRFEQGEGSFMESNMTLRRLAIFTGISF